MSAPTSTLPAEVAPNHHSTLGEKDSVRPRSGSHSSTWSYDEKHPVHSTLDDDEEDFLPVGAEVSPAVERRMSAKHDYSREHEPRDRRYSGTSAHRGPPSRKPTASYGYDPVTGQPDTGMGSPSQQLANIDWAHVLAASENKHAAPAATTSPTHSRKTPSRKPTASYGIDPVMGHPEHGHHHHPYPISENQPVRTEVSSSAADPGSQLTAEGPGIIRTESGVTMTNLRISCEYPKPT